MVGLLVILQYLTHHSAEAFNIMTDLKIPNIAEAAKAQQAKDRFGEKKIAVVTGTSSGLGRKTALALLRTGQYHVVGAVRDLDKMEAVAEIDEFDPDSFTAMHCELNSFESVRQFCHDLEKVRCHRPSTPLELQPLQPRHLDQTPCPLVWRRNPGFLAKLHA